MFNLLKKKNKKEIAGAGHGGEVGKPADSIVIDDKNIKTIPEKFLPTKSDKGSSYYKFIIIAIGVLIIIIGVFTGLLLFSDDFNEIIFGKDKIAAIDEGYEENVKIREYENNDGIGEEQRTNVVELGVGDEIAATEIFRKEALDEQGRVAGAIMFEMRRELEYLGLRTGASLLEVETISDEDNNQFKIIGGVYSFEPGGVKLADGELLVEIFYSKERLVDYIADDLVVLNWETEPEISFLTGNINELESLMEIKMNVLPRGKIALGVLVEVLVPPLADDETAEVAPVGALPDAEDSDGDGLTDSEEILYGMDVSMRDTDGNGLDDWAEVLSWYAVELDKDLDSSLEVYASGTEEYSIYYPSLWAIEDKEGEISFTADTGESAQIMIQSNPQNLSARDWYLQQASGITASQIKSGEINGLDAAWSLDQFTCYIAREENIYLINYNIGLRDEAGFKATFDAIVSSFHFPKMLITSYSYKNEDYGFNLELPLSWENYDVVNLQKNWGDGLDGDSLMFRLASEYPEECSPYDKCAIFIILH